jgi:hypothetical protein
MVGGTSGYIAVQNLMFAQPDAGPLLGYDLDGVCTCPGPPSCVSGPHCDLPGGRDTSGNQFVGLLDNFLKGSAAGDLNTQIAAGQLGLLFWVLEYNGEADDEGVGLAVMTSPGIIVDPEAGTTQPPIWDGTDVWNVNPSSVAGVTLVDGGYIYVPLSLSTNAYVTGGTLVATLPKVEISLGSASLVITDAVVTGILHAAHGGYDLQQGQLSGRVPTHDLQLFIATLRDPFNRSTFLCGNDATFQGFRSDLCQAADIMSDPALDGTDAGCNAISLVVGFNAVAANVGALYAGKPAQTGCDGSVVECTP